MRGWERERRRVGGREGGRGWREGQREGVSGIEQRDRREEKWKEGGGGLPVKTASVVTLVTSIYINYNVQKLDKKKQNTVDECISTPINAHHTQPSDLQRHKEQGLDK